MEQQATAQFRSDVSVLEILDAVQNLDPIGVAARDLQECLLLQIKQYPAGTPWVNEAITLIEDYLDLLGSKDYNTLKRKTRMSEETLAAEKRSSVSSVCSESIPESLKRQRSQSTRRKNPIPKKA